jgi:hypothetical protein
MNREEELLRRIRALTALIIAGLVISGATAIPLETELNLLARWTGPSSGALGEWIARVQASLQETNAKHPFMAYGTDWLAFGHFVIAIAFIGAWRDPVRNRWLFDFGLIASALVVPYALGFGAWRGIPIWWRLIDCSFGVVCAVPLWLCRQWTIAVARSRGCGEIMSRG